MYETKDEHKDFILNFYNGHTFDFVLYGDVCYVCLLLFLMVIECINVKWCTCINWLKGF